jgi:glutaredoxin-like protein
MSNMLDENIKSQVREVFGELQNPVEILFFGREMPAAGRDEPERCAYCTETKDLLEEVSALSDQLDLKVYDIEKDAVLAQKYKVDGVPAFVLAGRDGEQIIDYGIRYKGIPAGHEFSSLINDLILVARRDSNLSPETRLFLKELRQPVHLQVFVTPSCPYCPRSVVLAHQFALESPLVEAEMIEAMEFPELADRFAVSGVPQTTINMGAGTIVGSAPEQNLVAEIRAALEKSIIQ